jgi:hypothetical protein
MWSRSDDGFMRRKASACGVKLKSGRAPFPSRLSGLPAEIQDRAADIWEPLVAVADLVGGDWPDLARKAAVALVAVSNDSEPSLGIQLLWDLQTVFGLADQMTTEDILDKLRKLEESPWADLKGKPLDSRGLALRLRQYGVKSKNIAVGDRRPKGYTRADLSDIFRRHPRPSPDKSATNATTLPEPLSSGVAQVAQLSGHWGEQEVNRRRKCWHCHERGEVLQCSHAGVEFWAHEKCIDAWIEHYEGRT